MCRCLLIRRGIGAAPLGQVVQQWSKKDGMIETHPGSFSGLPPRPGSCEQGGRNRTMQ